MQREKQVLQFAASRKTTHSEMLYLLWEIFWVTA